MSARSSSTERSAEESIASALVEWYARVARDLPWRRDPSPYHVLLSELMLQQTRVETVIPYFERFTTRWPTLSALASATPEEVLHAWAGLGYYSRARNLLAAAVAANAAGGLPGDPQQLERLPGIGPYTAGAIASIAFGVRAPLVDGNVERVICRLYGIGGDPKRTARKEIWARTASLHEALPSEHHPGALNQALMELGATVCAPKGAKCAICPLSERCVAKRDDRVAQLPEKAAKPKAREVSAVSGIVCGAQGWLLGRRPPGLLGGLWEPLSAELPEKVAPEDEIAALTSAFHERAGVVLRSAARLGAVTHLFTHRRLSTSVFDATIEGTPRTAAFYEEIRWVSEPSSLPLSVLAEKILGLRNQMPLLAAEPGPEIQ